MDNEKFGEFIKNLRKQNNMTQKDLAQKLNITDKAVSKWERGLSFPDITMLNSIAEIFNISVSELLNSKIGEHDDIEVKKAVEEAVKQIENKEQKKLERNKKIKKVVVIISGISFVILILVQLAYFFVFKKREYEYVVDTLPYLFNEIIFISGVILLKQMLSKIKKINTGLISIFIILTIINIAFLFDGGLENKCIVSFSKNYSNELIIKKNRKTGNMVLYRYNKFFIFAKPHRTLEYGANGKVKTQWLARDICAITFEDTDGQLREYVATYGERANGEEIIDVVSTLKGEWETRGRGSRAIELIQDSKGITITRNNEKILFKKEECEQYGTSALILYTNKIPKYVIALNENCKIDIDTQIIKESGTITLYEVSMNKRNPEILYCMTGKSNLKNYRIAYPEENGYIIKNGILYIRYDNENVIEVPGDFSEGSYILNKENYQISKEKTVFSFNLDDERYLLFSDDMGYSWEKVELKENSQITNLQFLNKDVGYMLRIDDTALGSSAFGKICKTSDGGRNWMDIDIQLENEEKNVFTKGSQMKFIDEKVGFFWLDRQGAESAELFRTEDGGKTFSKINVIESDIYDYYSLPKEENGKLVLRVEQGSDGDYNGGDYKTYYSEDKGKSWKEGEK